MLRSFETPCAALAAALFGACALAAPAAAHAAVWANTATQAMPLNGISGVTALASSQQLHVVLGLNLHNKAQLDALVAAIGKPGSLQFGHTITPAQFLAAYAPTSDEAGAVVSYLKSQGFSGIEVSANRLTVSAYGSAAAVQSAFNTHLVSFLDSTGRSVFANSAPAQVPATLGGIVAAVVGLQNMGQMQTPLLHSNPVGTPVRLSTTKPAVGVPQNPVTTAPYSGPQYQTAYDAGSTPTGWGTTIGIVTEGDLSQVPKDLRQYEKEFGLPQVPYEIVPTGLQTSDTAGLDEWDLDSQSSSGIAGNLRKIIFYNAGSLGDPDLIPAYEKVVSEDRVKAVNMSFGGCETLEYLSGGMLLADMAYEQGAAEGITFFASAGDGGASCQVIANAGQPVVLGAVEYPASSPYVVAVGGTSLLTNSDYTYDAEISWVSGGGGTSLWEAPGVWTSGVIPVVNSTAGQRAVPDVAMVGDPNIGGADVVVNGADTGVGGTSLSSPLSVGTWARMQTAHGNCYGFAAPIFYGSFGQPFGTAAKDFHDIVLGDNFLYPAAPGWDFTTGLGSFDIAAVNANLPPVSCAPEAPVNLASGAFNGQVLLSWGGSAGATSYNVYVGSASGAEASSAVATSKNTTAVVSGLAPGKTYYFTVEAVNAAGSSAASNETSVLVAPAAPSALWAYTAASTGAVWMHWRPIAGVSGYNIYAGTSAGGEAAAPVMSGLTTDSATVSRLVSGKTYYFQVTAVANGIESGKSPESNAAAK